MIKNDTWIRYMCREGRSMIVPFEESLIRRVSSDGITGTPQALGPIAGYTSEQLRKVISYGTSSYGYDIRLSPRDFRVFVAGEDEEIDPKNFNASHLQQVDLQTGPNGDYFVIPAHEYALGVAIEKLNIPENICVICIGKSTYARIGLIANLTPAEAGWTGHLTLEFSNSSSRPCRIYANEGVVQLLFFEGEPCEVSYEARNGKYQSQKHEVTLARL